MIKTEKIPRYPLLRVVKDIRRAPVASRIARRRRSGSCWKACAVTTALPPGYATVKGIAQGVYYKWSKEFMEAGKRRVDRSHGRAANNEEVTDLRR